MVVVMEISFLRRASVPEHYPTSKADLQSVFSYIMSNSEFRTGLITNYKEELINVGVTDPEDDISILASDALAAGPTASPVDTTVSSSGSASRVSVMNVNSWMFWVAVGMLVGLPFLLLLLRHVVQTGVSDTLGVGARKEGGGEELTDKQLSKWSRTNPVRLSSFRSDDTDTEAEDKVQLTFDRFIIRANRSSSSFLNYGGMTRIESQSVDMDDKERK
jgi:hypothetical protein